MAHGNGWARLQKIPGQTGFAALFAAAHLGVMLIYIHGKRVGKFDTGADMQKLGVKAEQRSQVHEESVTNARIVVCASADVKHASNMFSVNGDQGKSQRGKTHVVDTLW